jgi:F-type H+-transporting ATPase subunit gamma
MTAHHQLKEQLQLIGDLKGVLVAMKNLALMESRKVVRFIENAHQSVETLDGIGADFLTFYPALPPLASRTVFLTLGSERGFCGDFNDAIVTTLLSQLTDSKLKEALVIAVGARLGERLPGRLAGLEEGHSPLANCELVSGASFAEEVGTVMRSLADKLQHMSALKLTVIYHDAADGKVRILEPLARLKSNGIKHSSRPQLNLDADEFSIRFIESYLFSILQYAFYGSLLCENLSRTRHLEDAVRRMEQRELELKRKTNAVRQEEITEELEIIMLTSGNLLTT